MGFDPLQHINQIFIRVNIVQPAGGKQALHNTDMLGASLSPAKKPILAAHGNRAQGTLKMIGVNHYIWIIEIGLKALAALACIRQRCGQRATGQ
jgi:hypothetical protein